MVEKKRPWWRLSAAFAALASLILLIAAAFIFQDNIARFLINPRTPFQTTPLPPAPEYGARGAWALWPDKKGQGVADVFYIHSTTAYARKYWNAPLSDVASQKVLRQTASLNEAGPFYDLGAVYGPRYRQATLYSFFTHKYDGVAARQAAFADVENAFVEFLRLSDNPERPIILVGYGQGALHALGLLAQYVERDVVLKKRMAAAYIIGHAIPPSFFRELTPSLPACSGPEDIRCVISYIDLESRFDGEMRRFRTRSMKWNLTGNLEPMKDELPICTNPLDWLISENYVSSEAHLGAASATGLMLGETPSPVAGALGAQCVRGILTVDRPAQSYLRRKGWFSAKWQAPNFNLFYHDLRHDAERRIALTQVQLTEEATNLTPITEAVEIIDSPINKVPD